MISIVILTHNRLGPLFRCIESIKKSEGHDYEIIVVDNCSTDETQEMLQNASGVRVLRFNEDTELAVCRNAGIDAARGDMIAFTDDDCIVEANWIERIEADLADFDAVGGIAKPLGKISFPPWWDDELNWMVGLSVPGHYGPQAGTIYLPGSLNLAYRAEVLKKLKFKEGLEGIGGKNMTREDSDLWMRTRSQGYSTFFDIKLIVYHKVPQKRFTLFFCIVRSFSDGFAAYYRENGEKTWRSKLKFVLPEPFRIINKKLNRSDGSRVHEIFWIIRESGFLYGHFHSQFIKSRRNPGKTLG